MGHFPDPALRRSRHKRKRPISQRQKTSPTTSCPPAQRAVIRTRWLRPLTEWAASSRRLVNARPGGTHSLACTRSPTSDRSSRWVHFCRPCNTPNVSLRSANFRSGRAMVIAVVSILTPKISSRVDGGEHFSSARGTPASLHMACMPSYTSAALSVSPGPTPQKQKHLNTAGRTRLLRTLGTGTANN